MGLPKTIDRVGVTSEKP